MAHPGVPDPGAGLLSAASILAVRVRDDLNDLSGIVGDPEQVGIGGRDLASSVP